MAWRGAKLTVRLVPASMQIQRALKTSKAMYTCARTPAGRVGQEADPLSLRTAGSAAGGALSGSGLAGGFIFGGKQHGAFDPCEPSCRRNHQMTEALVSPDFENTPQSLGGHSGTRELRAMIT